MVVQHVLIVILSRNQMTLISNICVSQHVRLVSGIPTVDHVMLTAEHVLVHQNITVTHV
jgi:hypothetical protein